jgi:hypothetical protein
MIARGLYGGFRIGLGRGKDIRFVLLAAVALAVSIAAAVFERRSFVLGAASRVLEGSVFAYVVPLVGLLGMAQILGRSRLDAASSALGRFGASRRAVAFGLVLAAMVLTVAVSAVSAAVAAAVAHDPTAPPALHDALTTAWIAGLAACAYAGLYAFGSTFGRRGGGRIVLFLVDWLVGSSGTAAALFLPHGHAENLLGAVAPLSVGQALSTASLALIAALFTLLSIRRCRP